MGKVSEHAVEIRNSLEKDLDTRAGKMKSYCESLVISDDGYYDYADKAAGEIAALKKGVKQYWAELKAGAYQSWKDICGKESRMLTPLNESQQILTSKMARYRSERDRIEKERQDAALLLAKEEAQYEAFKIVEEQDLPPEVAQAVMEQSQESVQVAPSQPELRGKTSFQVDYEVSLVPGSEHLIPLDILIPTTKGHISAVLAKAKAQAKLSGGKPIPGILVVQTQRATTKTS